MFDETETFEVTEDHIKLLENVCITWSSMETGAPQVDPKRPYGNSAVVGDMIEILEREDEATTIENGHPRITDEAHDEMMSLHGDMEQVVSILFDNPASGIEPGKYERERYGGTWTKI